MIHLSNDTSLTRCAGHVRVAMVVKLDEPERERAFPLRDATRAAHKHRDSIAVA